MSEIIPALQVPAPSSLAVMAFRRSASVAPVSGTMPTRSSHSSSPQVAVAMWAWSAASSTAARAARAWSVRATMMARLFASASRCSGTRWGRGRS